MKFVLPALATLALVTLPAFSQAPSPTPLDPAVIRAEVEALLKSRVQARIDIRNSALQEVQKRSQFGNSAVDFYVNAYTQMTFAGKPTGGQDKNEWGKKNAAILQSSELKAAAQLNLKYLALTLQRSGSDKPMDFVDPSLNYLREYTEDTTKLFARQASVSECQRQLLSSPLRESPIIKVEGWQALIKDFPDWEQTPGNVDGIFEKNIFGPLRAAKDPRLMDAWELRMDQADKAVAAQRLVVGKQDFAQVQFPTMRFTRAEDLLLLNRKEEAINEMYLLLKHYPDHPSFEKWGQRLLQIIAPPPAPAVP